jgi:hypothetical protein
VAGTKMPVEAAGLVAGTQQNLSNLDFLSILVKDLKILGSGISSTICKLKCSFILIKHLLISQLISFSFNQLLH